MKRTMIVGLLAIVLAAAGVWIWHASHAGAGVERGLRLSGNVEAHESLVGFKVSGRIVELPIEEGQTVTSGQLLARLDGDDLQQQVALDAATKNVREQQLKLSQAGARVQDVRAAEQAVVDARADLAQKQKDWARYEELYKKDEISGQTRDQAATNATRAAANLARQEQMLYELREGTRREQIAIDRASVRQADAAVGVSRVRANYATLRAPQAGVVLVRQAELGEVVQPGTPVATLADLDHPWVRVYLPETELAQLKLGQTVAVGTDSQPGKRYAGRVAFISAEAEFTPKSVQTEKERVTLVYRVKVDVENPNHELKPGMPADVFVGR